MQRKVPGKGDLVPKLSESLDSQMRKKRKSLFLGQMLKLKNLISVQLLILYLQSLTYTRVIQILMLCDVCDGLVQIDNILDHAFLKKPLTSPCQF
jgi:hypothetical protein